ncbi:MAG: flavin reductase family protein [Alphaproteobacteria bacterium]|nr:flavin reductase family protein [Alphaproteobacteria bacterium]MBV9371976.1 flavin reductase family protein [Alphaproteobacteria bacterium]MBV9902639.1 flavin reductase family protein [Alphaproteobacteria bacterium]
MSEADAALPDSFRQAMRRIASTVNVITICVGGEPMGITATAMSSISLDPPSLLVCINRTAAMHGRMEDVSHFRVNVLHRDQEEIARIFADRKHQALRFVDGWTVDCERPPRLIDAQASFLCRRIDHHRFGTHSIFIGQVEEVAVREGVDPLVYLNGRYAGAN